MWVGYMLGCGLNCGFKCGLDTGWMRVLRFFMEVYVLSSVDPVTHYNLEFKLKKQTASIQKQIHQPHRKIKIRSKIDKKNRDHGMIKRLHYTLPFNS